MHYKLMMTTLFITAPQLTWAAVPTNLQKDLEAAYTTGNPFVIQATLSAAKAQAPAYAAEIDAFLATLKAAPAPQAPKAVKKVEAVEEKYKGQWVPSWIQAWDGKVGASLVMKSGNTDTQEYDIDLEAKRDWRDWAVRVDAEIETAHDAGVRSEEKYKAALQGDYKLDEKSYVFAKLDHKIDNFDNIRTQTGETIGYGRNLYKTDTMDWEAQIGLGAQQTEDASGNDTNAFLIAPETTFGWKITEHLDFTQSLKADITSDLTELTSVTAIENDLTDNLALRASYEVERASTVPAGSKKTDTAAKFGLVYGF